MAADDRFPTVPQCAHVQNKGPLSGGSLVHPHMQIRFGTGGRLWR
ncbi:MAG: DUF4931 domain-containing protein [Collinsella sp.]